MSKGPKNQTTTTTPWPEQAHHLTQLFHMGQGLEQIRLQQPEFFPGDTFAGFDPLQQQGQQQALDYAQGAGQFNRNPSVNLGVATQPRQQQQPSWPAGGGAKGPQQQTALWPGIQGPQQQAGFAPTGFPGGPADQKQFPQSGGLTPEQSMRAFVPQGDASWGVNPRGMPQGGGQPQGGLPGLVNQAQGGLSFGLNPRIECGDVWVKRSQRRRTTC